MYGLQFTVDSMSTSFENLEVWKAGCRTHTQTYIAREVAVIPKEIADQWIIDLKSITKNVASTFKFINTENRKP